MEETFEEIRQQMETIKDIIPNSTQHCCRCGNISAELSRVTCHGGTNISACPRCVKTENDLKDIHAADLLSGDYGPPFIEPPCENY